MNAPIAPRLEELVQKKTIREQIGEVLYRELTGLALRRHGLVGQAVEVGVHRGYFAGQLLRHWPGQLHLVDPWTDVYPGYSSLDREEDYAACLQEIKPYQGRVVIHRSTSAAAAPQFSDASLDFVYIDAVHDEEDVRQDIRLWWPKVREGGILAGHDIVNGIWGAGVRAAVIDFVGKEDLDLFIVPASPHEPPPPDNNGGWYVWKPLRR